MWSRETFLRACTLAHVSAVQARLRDGLCAEALLGWRQDGLQHVTVLGTGAGINPSWARAVAPRAVHVLDRTIRTDSAAVTHLLHARDVIAIAYLRCEPDGYGPRVRTAAVWPEEVAVLNLITDVQDPRHPVPMPADDSTSRDLERWLITLLPCP
jgi:hypothetical protein